MLTDFAPFEGSWKSFKSCKLVFDLSLNQIEICSDFDDHFCAWWETWSFVHRHTFCQYVNSLLYPPYRFFGSGSIFWQWVYFWGAVCASLVKLWRCSFIGCMHTCCACCHRRCPLSSGPCRCSVASGWSVLAALPALCTTAEPTAV